MGVFSLKLSASVAEEAFSVVFFVVLVGFEPQKHGFAY